MEATIQEVTKNIQVNSGMLKRLCEHLGIHLYDQTINYNFGDRAILNDKFVRFISKNKSFFKNYQDDYYKPKCPKSIALTINRNVKEVDDYLKEKFPYCYVNGVFGLGANKHLKYISSYEIDYEISLKESEEARKLGALAWHLGLNQKMMVENMNGDQVVAKFA
jgi:hypothetical protein